MTELLVRAGHALLDPEIGTFQRDVGIVVRDGRIASIEDWAAIAGRMDVSRSVGGPEFLATPGLVNAHQHGLGLGLTRLGNVDAALELWVLWRYAPYTPDVYMDTLLAALQMLASGVTTAVHAHYYRGPEGYRERADAAIRAYVDAGLRVVFCPGISDQNQLAYGETASLATSMDATSFQYLMDLERAGMSILADDYFLFVDELAKTHERPRGRVTVGYYPITPQSASDPLLTRMAAAATENGRIIHTHLVETLYQSEFAHRAFGTSHARHLDEIGFLGPNVSFGHAVWVEEPDLSFLARSGATLAHCPSSNLRIRSGIAPTARYLAAGIKVALGTDNLSLAADEDLIAEMRMASIVSARTGIDRPGGNVDDVWRMATVNGAAALGLGDDIGRLAVGREADIVLFNSRDLHTITDDPPPHEALVRFGSRGNVDTVIVGGEIIVRDGRNLRFGVEDIRREALASVTAPDLQAIERLDRIRGGIKRHYAGWGGGKIGHWNALDD